MWESPIYRFKNDVNGKSRQILIDVTGSAPTFKVPGKQLEGAFDIVLEGLEPKKTKILDFGAAKLRNTIYLLKKGYKVYSCEFNDLFQRSKQADDFLSEARKFKNFKSLVFPKDFIDFDDEFDVVLLINVLNVMPVPLERLCVLALCREKMTDGGRLLWYTQHGGYSDSDAVAKLFDGLVTGKGREYNMFYRDFSRREIHDTLQSTGFSFNSKFKFPEVGNNQAYVFNADGAMLVDETLGLTQLLKRKVKTKLKTIEREARWKVDDDDSNSKKIVYETSIPARATGVKEINLLETWMDELTSTIAGKKNASKYHDLIYNILLTIIGKRLRGPKKEEYIGRDTQRVDITFKNERDDGFFKQLDQGYHITCPNIFVECKNYNHDIGNPEFGQMALRLNNVRGQFGIMVCRQIIENQRVMTRQDDLIKKGMYVIVLEDSDIRTLVKLKVDGKESEIDDYLEEKFKKLT